MPRVRSLRRLRIESMIAIAAIGCTSVSQPKEPEPKAQPPKPIAAAPCKDGFGEAASFALSKSALRKKGASANLLAKIDASAYRYFRMLGRQMAAQTCFALRDVRWHLPVVAVHGDAHVEQFTVTRETFGLEDFDQAGFGPAAVDIVRYAASLHMACREVSWTCNAEQAVAVYFREYRAALARQLERPVPRIVERLRRSAPQERSAWLEWADSLMQPLPSADERHVRAAWSRFTELQVDARPDRPASFYEIARLGGLEMGVGSALEKKVLLRVQGPSEAPADDLILEARTGAGSTGNDCAWRSPHGGSLQALMFMSLLGPRMPQVYGVMPSDDNLSQPDFWVQSWDPGYRELSLADLETQTELDELAADAARQLAGHFWMKFPEVLRLHQRNAQLTAFDLIESRARKMAADFAAETVAAWESFRKSP
jgi:hypothetical protein